MFALERSPQVIREPLVLASGGAVEKAYATGVQAVVMLLAVPVYAALAKRADPRRLLIGVTLSVVVLLEAFAWLADTRLAWVGFAFYVLAGIVGVLFVSQFWSFANDLVDEARGERIFPLVALGASAGSWFGSELSARLIEWGVGVPTLLRIAAGTLAGFGNKITAAQVTGNVTASTTGDAITRTLYDGDVIVWEGKEAIRVGPAGEQKLGRAKEP